MGDIPVSRRKPYDRDHEPDDWGERAEWRALVDADFEGLPREALIASIRHLAGRLLEGVDLDAPDPKAEASETMLRIREHHAQPENA